MATVMVYVLGVAGLLGALLQQVALQIRRRAPAVATGSVANPLVSVRLGIVLLEERLAPPTGHKAVAFAALGCALAAAVAISLSGERQRAVGLFARRRPDEGDAAEPGRLKPAPDAPA